MVFGLLVLSSKEEKGKKGSAKFRFFFFSFFLFFFFLLLPLHKKPTEIDMQIAISVLSSHFWLEEPNLSYFRELVGEVET